MNVQSVIINNFMCFCDVSASLSVIQPTMTLFDLFSQAGYLESLLMLVVGYGVVVLTVLSISAIATNGNVEGGGVYCILNLNKKLCVCGAGDS